MLTDKYRYHIYPNRIYVIEIGDGKKVEIPGHRLEAYALRYSLIQKYFDDEAIGKSDTELQPLDMPHDSHSSSE